MVYRIVVARHNENINWLLSNKNECVVYNKGDVKGSESFPNVKSLKNVGRESHAYFQYIIDEYDNLPDYIIFTQGKISDHVGKDDANILLKYLLEAMNDNMSHPTVVTNEMGFPWGPNWNMVNPQHYTFRKPVKSREIMCFSDWFEKVLCITYPKTIQIYKAALFSVSKENIIQHSKQYYEYLQSHLDYDIDPVECHFFERSWYYIFNLKRNLLYMCVFHNEKYIELLKLLLITLKTKSNFKHTDILINTSTFFKTVIEREVKMLELNLPILYFIKDGVGNVMEASSSKLDIFEYKDIDKYNKILYLDTDILINRDISNVFEINIDHTKLYALEEGNIKHIFWGGDQFWDSNVRDIPAFSAGVFLFVNNTVIKELFNDVKRHIIRHITEGKRIPECLEQPFLVYNSISQNKYDNQLMKEYIECNPSKQTGKHIYHFPGGPGNYSSKIQKMAFFFKNYM